MSPEATKTGFFFSISFPAVLGEFTDKKENLLCIQWFVVVATCYLVIFRSGQIAQDPLSYLLVIIAFGSILALQRMPPSVFDHSLSPKVLVVVDTILISTAITLNRESPWDLLLLFFFAIFIAAIGEGLLQIVTGCIALSVISIFIVPIARQGEFVLHADHLLRIPLLFGASLLYGYLVDQVKREKKKLVELEESRRQQLLIKDQFLSHVSHELRSPLSAIYQFVTILKDGLAGDLNDEQRDYLGIVLRNAQQLRSMIDELLEVTRAATGKLTIQPQRVSIADLLSDTLSMLLPTAAVKNVTLSADASPNLPSVYADPQRFKQILINLVDNAIKFTPSNGTVSVHTGVFDQDPDFICFSVADTGCGISPEGTQRIFERLYQESNSIEKSRKGLGLGLHICKELVSQHGGRIWVESQLGKGSVFFFTLPVFSLSKLLSPVITENDRLKDHITLITVEISVHMGPSLSDIAESARRAADSVLQRFISPDTMLLPSVTRASGVFHIVTSSTRDAAHTIAQHIREELERCDDIAVPGLEVSVSEAGIETPSAQEVSSLNELVEQVVIRITELLDSENVKEIRSQKTDLFAAMSEEVRTPLSVVVGYAAVMRDKLLGHLNPEQENALNKVVRHTNDLVLMVNNVVEFQKIASGTMKVGLYKFDLASMFDDLKANFEGQSTAEVSMTWDYPVELPEMTTDGLKLKQILQNIIHNAMKFTPSGNVAISARHEFAAEAERVEFKIADSGIGIPPEGLRTLFDKFPKRNRAKINLMGGMGLGLYVAQTLTERLGGHIAVESIFGKGSVFTVCLPLHTQVSVPRIEQLNHFRKRANANHKRSNQQRFQEVSYGEEKDSHRG
jgi:signal transduction histidine kinase